MAASTSSNGARFRLYALSGLLCLWLLTICLRLVYLQIFCYGDFERRAQHQQQRSFDLSPKRGVIYDRAGRELAMSIQVDSAFVVPSEAPDLSNTISLITRITKDDPRVVLADCRAHKTFCWVARKADAEVIERIRALNLQGIHYQKEPKRFYPKRELAAQILGYVGTDDQGRDVLSAILYGMRLSLAISGASVLLALALGIGPGPQLADVRRPASRSAA